MIFKNPVNHFSAFKLVVFVQRITAAPGGGGGGRKIEKKKVIFILAQELLSHGH